jgi:uncharacterized membrane protein
MVEEKSEEIAAEITTPSKDVSNISGLGSGKREMPKPEVAEEGFGIEESFKVGWEIFKDNAVLLIFVVVVVFGLQIASEAISLVLANMGQDGLNMAASLLSIIAQVIIEIGVVNIFLRAYDKKNIGVGDLFSRTDRIWVFIGVGIVMNFITMGGMVLLLVPGVIAIIALFPVTLLAVDKKMGVIDIIKASWAITQGNKISIFVFIIAAMIFNFLGLISLGIGALVTLPITFLATVHIYRKLLIQAERKNKIPVEKLQTVPKIFLWIGIALIPLGILMGVMLIAVGAARGGM